MTGSARNNRTASSTRQWPDEAPPRAGKPADDDRRADLESTGLGMLLQVVDHQQSVDQELLDLIPRRQPAQRTEARLVVECVQQHGVGLAVDVVTEVVETGLASS